MSDEIGIMDRRVLEALAAGEAPDARLHHPLVDKVMFLIFEKLRKVGLIRYESITDASHVRPIVTDAGRAFLDRYRERVMNELKKEERVMNELTKEVGEVLSLLKSLSRRLANLDVPEESAHLQSYALDGMFGAVGYLETLTTRMEETES